MAKRTTQIISNAETIPAHQDRTTQIISNTEYLPAHKAVTTQILVMVEVSPAAPTPVPVPVVETNEMTSRIRIYDKSGTWIYEVNAQAFREFVINDIGSASFTIRASGMQPYIEFGNFITIEHGKLDTWVGVIVPPRTWSPKVITVNCKSMMWMFGQRVGSYEQVVSGSWGAVFSQVLGIANSTEDTLMRIGSYSDGVDYSSVADMSNLYTYLQRALAQAQTRLDFRPVVTNGRLQVFVDIQPTLYTASDLRLEEGLNVKASSSVLLEQGDVHNDITILGTGTDQIKYTANAVDKTSISTYGRRQFLISEGTSQSDVDRLAVVRLAQYAYPRKTLGLVVMDKGDTFLKARVGNTGSVELKSVGYLGGSLGFRGTVSIKGLQFDDKTNEATLVCLEI